MWGQKASIGHSAFAHIFTRALWPNCLLSCSVFRCLLHGKITFSFSGCLSTPHVHGALCFLHCTESPTRRYPAIFVLFVSCTVLSLLRVSDKPSLCSLFHALHPALCACLSCHFARHAFVIFPSSLGSSFSENVCAASFSPKSYRNYSGVIVLILSFCFGSYFVLAATALLCCVPSASSRWPCLDNTAAPFLLHEPKLDVFSRLYVTDTSWPLRAAIFFRASSRPLSSSPLSSSPCCWRLTFGPSRMWQGVCLLACAGGMRLDIFSFFLAGRMKQKFILSHV